MIISCVLLEHTIELCTADGLISYNSKGTVVINNLDYVSMPFSSRALLLCMLAHHHGSLGNWSRAVIDIELQCAFAAVTTSMQRRQRIEKILTAAKMSHLIADVMTLPKGHH